LYKAALVLVVQRTHFLLVLMLGLALPAIVAGQAASPAGPQASVHGAIDGPAGYAIACSLNSGSAMRACEDLPSARYCASEPNYASRPSKERTGMTFVNRSEAPVDIYWLGFQGERVPYQHLPPGGRFVQQTFIGHNWLVTDIAGQCVGIFKAAPESIAFF
jgi:VHL beta domain